MRLCSHMALLLGFDSELSGMPLGKPSGDVSDASNHNDTNITGDNARVSRIGF